MRATKILQQQFDAELQDVHLARRKVVFSAVSAVLSTSKVSLTSVGRAIAERTTHKHGIKRMDRLLGNRHLHAEQITFYRAIARRVVRTPRPIILIDWTAITPGLWALAAAVCVDGRALIIYSETHPISEYAKRHIHQSFVEQLASVLPSGCQPIIVADAGFRAPFMKLVLEVGWDYVIRLRGPVKLRRKHGRSGRPRRGARPDSQKRRGWFLIPHLFGTARPVPRDCGFLEIGRMMRHRCRVVTVRHPVRHRRYRCRTRKGLHVKRARDAAREPWVLATSLADEPARIVTIYAKRMQIEETFRDAKSPRFGLSLTYARPRSEARANVLMLLVAIAHLFLLLLGLAAETAGLHRDYQANTVRDRRVLSLVMLGRHVFHSAASVLLQRALSTTAWSAFHVRAAQN
jgi:Transposase DDE domain